MRLDQNNFVPVVLFITIFSVVSLGSAYATSSITGTVTIIQHPTITLTPNVGSGGTTVTISGLNFSPNQKVSLTFVDSLGQSTSLGTVTIDTTGSFAKIVKIPAGAYPGTATVSVQQNSAVLTQTNFTVPFPAITLNPTFGQVGTKVTITGSLFSINQKVNLFIGPDISHNLVSLGSVTTDSGGSFTSTPSIPSTLSVGAYFISAREVVNNGVYAAAPFTITPKPSTTTIKSSVNPSTFGQSVTFTATVSPSTATGTVTFVIDGVSQATVTVSSSHAAFALSTMSVGSHTVTAQYSGDSNFAPSVSSVLTQTVGKDNTKTTLRSSLNPSTVGQPITFTATVSPVSPGSGLPTGTITFSIDGVDQKPVKLTSNQASMSTSALTKGSHHIIAKYSGDSSFNLSTSNTVTQSLR